MRFIVLDSGLRARSGHHDQFARGFGAYVRAAGGEVRYLAAKSVDADVARECNATPFFTVQFYGKLSRDRFDGVFMDAPLRAASYERDLDRLEAHELTDDDVILMPTAGPAESWACCDGERSEA